tara:strand:+ start:5528 stop:6235 length:708 start_codon:yes stop_codon:yes gene_type:complete
MIKFLNPSYIFFLTGKIINFIKIFILPIIIIGIIFSLFISPEDYIQGDSARIMYVHVPSAWISLSCFGLIALLCIINFIFKIKSLSLIYKSLAPIGLTFNFISILTGSLWGKPTWGTWWAWDARLTSMLVLMFFYIIFIFSYKFIRNAERSSKICASISLLGLINLVIIKYSVDWWSTLHQPSSINLTGETTVHFSMLIPLGIMLFAFLLYSALIFLMKYRIETIRVKKKSLKKL